MECPQCSEPLERAILAQDGPNWMCKGCYTRTPIRCRACDGPMHRIQREWSPRADAGIVACAHCGTGMRVREGQPRWLDRDDDARRDALEAVTRRRSSEPPPSPPPAEEPEPQPEPQKPETAAQLFRKPKAFAREAHAVPAARAGFRDSAEPDKVTEIVWQSTTKIKGDPIGYVALGFALVMASAFGADKFGGGIVWPIVALLLMATYAVYRERHRAMTKHKVRVREHELEVDEVVVPRVRVEEVVVQSEPGGLHRVVLMPADVVVDETSQLEHARWIERELKKELEATSE